MTTRMMLGTLPAISPEGKTVLDAGTGTGILAIATAKLGAERVFGYDMDTWSVQNAVENVLLNQVEGRVKVEEGGIEIIKGSALFDLILANINKNVILADIERFEQLLSIGGTLSISGFLRNDRSDILEKMKGLSLHLADEKKEDEWLWMRFDKI